MTQPAQGARRLRLLRRCFRWPRLDLNRRWELTLVALALSISATLVGWYASKLLLEQQAITKFDSRTREIQELIRTRLQLYLSALANTKGLYAASKSVERNEFRAFFTSTHVLNHYPGLLAVAFVERVTAEHQAAFVERVRTDTSLSPSGYPAFAISPPLTEAEAYVVTYIESDHGLEKSHGLDLRANPLRRRMLDRARDTGEMAITERLALLTDDRQPGFLVGLPIYHNGASLATVEDRRLALIGFVVGAFDSKRFFADVFQGHDAGASENLDMEVFDQAALSFLEHGTLQASEDHRLFDMDPARFETVEEHRMSRFHSLVAFPVADRTWSLHFVASPGFGLDLIQRSLPPLILIGGSVLSVLLFGLVHLLATSQTRAMRLAEQMTSELRTKQEQLLTHEQALAAELEEHKRLKDDLSKKADELGRTNLELLRREKITQSLLEDLRTSKQRLEQQQRSLEEAHANLQRSHDEMLAVQLQLIQSEKLESIGRLAAGVAHEVKNPLAVILMGVTYLARQMGNGDPNIPMVLNEMDLAVRKADTVVRGLLDFSAPSEIHLRDEDLNAIIDQALILVKHELHKAHVAVVKEAAPLPPVNLDGNKVQQALINLLINAAHAMPNGGTLTIRTSLKPRAAIEEHFGAKDSLRFARQEALVVVEVEDTGVGIPTEKLHKVFDPFFTTKPTGKGTGLGLTVTKKIVELHGGLIDVRNRPGGGVLATVVFASPGARLEGTHG